MFSLIITVVSVALFVAVAAATMYSGGDALQDGASAADAAKLASQAQQLQGAAEFYASATGAYPVALADLVSGEYLTSIPSPSLALAETSGSTSKSWELVLAGHPVFAVQSVPVAVCEALNLQAFGVKGIPKLARTLYSAQCFGPDVDHLTVVSAKFGGELLSVAGNPLAPVKLGTVLTTAPPALDSSDTTDAGWLKVPDAGAAAPAPGSSLITFTVTDSSTGVVLATAGPSGSVPVGTGAFTSSTMVGPGTVSSAVALPIANAAGDYVLAASPGASATRTLVVKNVSTSSGAVHTRWRAYGFDQTEWAPGVTRSSDCGAVLAPQATCSVTIGLSVPASGDFRTVHPNAYSKEYLWSQLLFIQGVADPLQGSLDVVATQSSAYLTANFFKAPVDYGSFRVQIAATGAPSLLTLNLTSVDGESLANISNRDYGNGYAYAGAGPGTTVSTGTHTYKWRMNNMNAPLGGTSGSVEISSVNSQAFAMTSMAEVSSGNIYLEFKDPYVSDTGSMVLLPPAGGVANPIWCVTYQRKAPGNVTRKVGEAVAGACL